MKQFFGTIGCCLSLACVANALEVSDLPVKGLTRDYADSNFSKDYDYCILSDYSVRRTWKAEGYTLVMDFDIRSSNLLSLYIDYEPAMPKAEAMQHMRHLCEGRDEDTKWVKTKEKSAARVGLKNARHRCLTDGSYLFWESAGSRGDCERMCWFAEAPRQDRLQIAKANKNTGKTAMGSAVGGAGFEALFRDEERRRGSAATTRPAVSAPAEVQPDEKPSPTPSPVPSSVPSPAPSAAPTTTPEPVAGRSAQPAVVSTAPNLFEKLGIEWNEQTKKWLMYGGGALLLLIIWNRIAAARRRARQTAAFEALLRQGKGQRDEDGEN